MKSEMIQDVRAELTARTLFDERSGGFISIADIVSDYIYRIEESRTANAGEEKIILERAIEILTRKFEL